MIKFHYMGTELILTKLFCLLFFLGVVFFVIWAMRTFKKKQLKKWAMGLLIIGLLGMVGSSYLMMKNKGDVDEGDWKVGKCEYCEKICGTPGS